ncbi:hypothetical protein AB0D56_19030 [Streptomyces sp. NPDC048209]|uniref:hypothetical protein n=1 Tax=unclassified Streptomyces TaxID=2593676 RepID=UPI003324EBEF
MQDTTAISAEAARQWLREHFEGNPAPQVDITFRSEEPDPVAYRRLLEIVFHPRTDTPAT